MRLRKLQEKDASRILAWMKDPTVNQYFRFDPQQVNEKGVRAFISSAQNDETHLHLACVDEEDHYLGTVSLKNINKTVGLAEYAISFSRQAQGTGAARFATIAILKKAFHELGLAQVFLNVLDDNKRAVHFYQKVGFVEDHRGEDFLLLRGKVKTLHWFTMTKERYEALYGQG